MDRGSGVGVRRVVALVVTVSSLGSSGCDSECKRGGPWSEAEFCSAHGCSAESEAQALAGFTCRDGDLDVLGVPVVLARREGCGVITVGDRAAFAGGSIAFDARTGAVIGRSAWTDMPTECFVSSYGITRVPADCSSVRTSTCIPNRDGGVFLDAGTSPSDGAAAVDGR